jgi:hypothetical protein
MIEKWGGGEVYRPVYEDANTEMFHKPQTKKKNGINSHTGLRFITI